MANNKKQYQIVINGLEESVKSVDTLIQRLGELQKTLSNLSKDKIEIPIELKGNVDSIINQVKQSISSTKIDVSAPTDNSSDAEYVKLLQQRKDALEAVNKELGTTAMNSKEFREETKQLVAMETQARNEAKGYANTMAGLKQELKDLNAQKNHIDLGSEEFVQVSKRIYDVNAKLKQLEATQNVFSRNVGNYTNAIKEAAQESENEAKSIQSLEEALEQMNKMKVTVEVDGVERQFNSLKEATRTLNNEAKALGLQLEHLKKSGGEGTPEYQKLEQQFNATAQAADDLEHSVANVNQSISEIKDDSGSLGKLTNAFEAFNDVAQVGIGISGLFGQSQEDIQKAMNRTIQLTTALNGVRKLLDKTTQSGIIINKMYEATLKALGTSATQASVGVKLLAGALTTIGVGALVIAIGTLIDGISKMVEHFKNAKTQADRFRDSLNDLKTASDQFLDSQKRLTENKYKLGLISEIDKLKANLINAQTVADTFQLKILGMIKTLKELKGMTQYEYGIIKDVDVTNIESVRKALVALTPAYDALIIKQQQITEGRLADVKALTVQEQALISFYDTLQEIINSQAAINDYYKNQSKSQTTNAVNSAKERAKKLQEIDKKIEKNTIDAMKDGWKKQLAQLKYEHEQEVKEAEETAKELKLTEEKKQQLLDSIHAKHTKFRMDAEKQHLEELKKLNVDFNNAIGASYDDILNKLITRQNQYNQLLENNSIPFQNDLDNVITPLDKVIKKIENTDVAKSLKGKFKKVVDEIKLFFNDDNIYSNLDKNLKHANDVIAKWEEELKKSLETYREGLEMQEVEQARNENRELANSLEERLNIYKNKYNDIELETRKYFTDIQKMAETIRLFSNVDNEEDEKKYREAYAKQYEELAKLYDQYAESDKKDVSDHYQDLMKLLKNFIDERELLTDIQNNRRLLNQRDMAEKETEIERTMMESQLSAYQKQYDELEKLRERYNQNVRTGNYDIDLLGQIVLENAEINKFKKSYSALNKEVAYQIELNEKQIEEYQAQIEENNKKLEQLRKEKEAVKQNNAEYAKTQKILQENTNKEKELKENIERTKETIASYKEDLEQLKLDNGDNEVLIFDKEKAIKELEEAVAQFQKELDGLNLNGLKEELDKFTKNYDEEISELESKNIKLNIQVADLRKSNSELGGLYEEINKFLNGTLKSWKDWSKNIAQILYSTTNIIGDIINNLAEATYNKTVSMIDAQLEELDDYMNELDRKLDKQAELIEKYNDRINDSEDELRDARGSRRQFLIDTLAAQQQAYLEEYAVQQKLEKEKEAAEKRREKLEKDKEKAEKRRNKAQQKVQIAQALASTAVAVTNALSVPPFFLGLSLAALAAAMGAAQVKAISSVKYADGGLLKGRSHREGGIPVGNTGIEVEGQEFIVNKQSTAKNLPLLEYINDNRRTLTAEDVVKLLKSNNTPIAKTSSTARKYADGGKLPTLQTEAIQRTVEVRDSEANSRNYVVQVVDIVNKMDNLNSVRTLSGLNND